MHCEEFLTKDHKIFCEDCFYEMEQFSLEEDRCLNCFNPIEGSHNSCKTCHNAIFTALLAVFPLMGTAATFHSKLKTLYGSYLCKAAGAFMAMHLLNANWPLPDLVIALPQTVSEKFFSNHKHNAAIAKELAFMLNRPYVDPFGFNCKRMDFSRIKPHVIENKSLLLVADVLTNQGKIHECAEILAQGYPKNIYGIALCQTV